MQRRPSNWGWSPIGRRRYAVLALWLAHGLWVLSGKGPAHGMAAAASALSRPAQWAAAKWDAWKAGRAERLRNFEQAQAEVQWLRQQLQARQAEEARLAPKLAEAEEAIHLLRLKEHTPVETVGARVIFSTRPAVFGGIFLDQGQDAGLQPDQGVICPEGVVGRLWSVSARQAKVLPADAPNASIGVMLARSRATGVLQGQGFGRAEVRYISNQEVVQVGEAVYTSGLDRVFPRGLLVGYVTEIRPGDLELRVRVQLAAPFHRLHHVLILPKDLPLEPQTNFLPEAPKGRESKPKESKPKAEKAPGGPR